MTYCVGVLLDAGLVMVSDTRTNAGVDHIATYRKMQVFEVPGERVMVMTSAGNLAVTQAVLNLLDEGVGDDKQTLLTVPTMFDAVRLVGRAVREVYHSDAPAMSEQGADFNASFILGGQIKGRTLRLFQIYSAGNYIEATVDTPFFQIGEIKYGKPILDRALRWDTSLTDATKLALVSMDSTMRSNISVGLPIDMSIYERDSFRVKLQHRVQEDDPYFTDISRRWSQALQAAYHELPDPPW